MQDAAECWSGTARIARLGWTDAAFKREYRILQEVGRRVRRAAQMRERFPVPAAAPSERQ